MKNYDDRPAILIRRSGRLFIKGVEVITIDSAARALGMAGSTIRKYFKEGILTRIAAVDPDNDRIGGYVLLSSFRNFDPKTRRKGGKPLGSKDKNPNPEKRRAAARANGYLGGLAGAGKPKSPRIKKVATSDSEMTTRKKRIIRVLRTSTSRNNQTKKT